LILRALCVLGGEEEFTAENTESAEEEEKSDADAA
jgi:hypothetical protein